MTSVSITDMSAKTETDSHLQAAVRKQLPRLERLHRELREQPRGQETELFAADVFGIILALRQALE